MRVIPPNDMKKLKKLKKLQPGPYTDDEFEKIGNDPDLCRQYFEGRVRYYMQLAVKSRRKARFEGQLGTLDVAWQFLALSDRHRDFATTIHKNIDVIVKSTIDRS